MGRVIDFTGKSVSEVESWGNSNNITIKVEFVEESDDLYNSNVLNGLVGNQSVKSGTALNGINRITVYVNSVSE